MKGVPTAWGSTQRRLVMLELRGSPIQSTQPFSEHGELYIGRYLLPRLASSVTTRGRSQVPHT